MEKPAGTPAVLYASRLETPLGPVDLYSTRQGLCCLDLPGSSSHGWLARTFPGHRLEDGARLHAPLARSILHHLAGPAAIPAAIPPWPLDLRGTGFQRQVWEALLRIPVGQTVTYAELARQVGRPGAARAVGGAVGANPVPLLVPCHRVVAAGGLGGFSSGTEMKARLLTIEGVRIPARTPDTAPAPAPAPPAQCHVPVLSSCSLV